MPPLGVLGVLVGTALVAGIDVLARKLILVAGFVSLGSVLLAGMQLAALCRRARCRSVLTATALGFVLGCLALYLNWVWFEAFLLPANSPEGANALTRFGTLFLHPGQVWEHVRSMAETGFTALGRGWRRETHQGTELRVAWTVDAFWTVYGLTVLTRTGVTDEVFCENCGKWAQPWQSVHLLHPKETARLRAAKQGDFETALTFALDPSKAALPRLRLTVHRCEGCLLLHAWQLSEVKKSSTSRSGEVTTSTVSPFYVLSPGEVEQWQKFP